ncbi:MAG: cation diffusion facilitator family transporter, partial [Chromatiales bacterium]
NDRTEQKERPYLLLAAAGNLTIGCVGLVVSVISSSQAIMLDGLFNLTYFIVGLFTLKVARLVQKGDDERFPHGYAFFEPLVNGIKGVLVLGISVMALAGSVQALFEGGREIAAGLAVAYGLFATVTCGVMALITHRGRVKTQSPLVQADAENWLVNTAISAAVLVAFAAMYLIRDTSLDFLVPYVDPIVVLLVVLISISVPVRMAWQALMELLNRTPSPEIVDEVRKIITESTSGLPVEQLFVRVVQPGRTRMVLVHVVLPSDYAPGPLTSLDALRMGTLERLQAAHLATILDMVFTADPKWGAPLSESTHGAV